MSAERDPWVIVCRCEELYAVDIVEAVRAGARTLDEIKRLTRCGMGPCQWKTCGSAVATILANEAGVSPSYFTRIFRLSFLAPEISQTILHGRQPTTLTAKNLMLQGKLALAWSKQRAQLGLA